MTVYFTASVAGKKRYLEHYFAIIKILKAKGHQVISDHILKTTTHEIQFEKRDDRIKFHDQLEKWIRSSDFVIAETSFPSVSVGYEISLSINLGKPVLILYSDGKPPTLFADFEEEEVVCRKYTDKTLPDIITDFIKLLKNNSDVRFTFYITKEISNFLEKISLKEKVPKSVYLRELIEQEIREALP